MTLIDTLRPEHRRLLRRLRKRIANRENMRRYRNDINYMQLCPGVDLPLEAGTCGRLICPKAPAAPPAASGAIGSCNTRSTPSRSPCPRCSTAPRPTTPSTTTARTTTSARPSPCSTSCPHSAIRACAGSARTSDPIEDDTAAGTSHDDTRDHLPAVVPTLDELTDLGDPCLRG